MTKTLVRSHNRLVFFLLTFAPGLMLYAIVNTKHSTMANNALGAISGVIIGFAILLLIQRSRVPR